MNQAADHSSVSADSDDERAGNDAASGKHSAGQVVVTALFVVAASAFSAFLIGKVHGDNGYFQFPEEVSAQFPPMGTPIPPEILELNERTLRGLDYSNTAVSFAMIGMCLCAAAGIAAGLHRKSAAALAKGLSAGVVLGGVCGAVAGLSEVFIGSSLDRIEGFDSMLKLMIVHAAAWVLISLSLAATVAVAGKNSVVEAMGRAAPGGLLAGLLYLPIAGILFVGNKSDLYVPEGNINRLFWISLSGLLIVLALHFLRVGKGKSRTAAA